MNILLGLFGLAIQFAIIGGIVFLIVRLVANRDSASSEGTGIAIRRFFQYTVMLAMLLLTGIGLAGLINAAVASTATIARGSASTALWISFVFVGLPVFVGMSMYTLRRLKDGPREQNSLGWAFYLTIALVGSLVTVMSLVVAFLAELLDDRRVDRTILVHAVVWTAVWVGHWWVAHRWVPRHGARLHLLLGSAAGLIATLTGVISGLIAVLQQIYDRIFLVSVLGSGLEDLVRPLIILVVGVPVWWWYWFRHTRDGTRTTLWLAYVILLGILGGAVTAISGAGIMLFGLLQWIVGDPSSATAAGHFALLPGALGTIAGGSAGWAYHSLVLGRRPQQERSEVDRVHDYVLAGAGLAVAATGITTLLSVTLRALGARPITESGPGDSVAVALTLLVIGVPLWWRYWSAIRRSREMDLTGELHSITRRIYIFLIFGVAGIVTVINLIVVVFITFEDILDGAFGGATLRSAAVPISLLLTASALAWYHFTVFREDRAALESEDAESAEAEALAPRSVIVVSRDGEELIEAIRTRTNASVSSLHVVGDRTAARSLEDVLEVLATGQHQRVIVVLRRDDGYDVIPIAE